jgi:hypothetical protein
MSTKLWMKHSGKPDTDYGCKTSIGVGSSDFLVRFDGLEKR